jgi:hypothetical protein
MLPALLTAQSVLLVRGGTHGRQESKEQRKKEKGKGQEKRQQARDNGRISPDKVTGAEYVSQKHPNPAGLNTLLRPPPSLAGRLTYHSAKLWTVPARTRARDGQVEPVARRIDAQDDLQPRQQISMLSTIGYHHTHYKID